MKLLILLFLQCMFFVSYAQVDVVDDFSQSGGITIETPLPERYAVNPVIEFPIKQINVNELVGASLLLVGNTYEFTVDVTNLLDKEIKVAHVLVDCVCEQANWIPNTVSPGGKRNVTIKLTPTIGGDLSAKATVLMQDPLGVKPMAIQRVELTFKVQ